MKHRFRWTGSMPCTGVYQCSACGKPTSANPLDYSSVDYSERCPNAPAILTHDEIETLARQNHYVINLISLKQIWGMRSSLGVVMENNKTIQLKTIADLINNGLCDARFAIIDDSIGELKDIHDVPLKLRGNNVSKQSV